MKGGKQMARTTALANQKGGVGKSTCTYGIARALSLAGRSVLVVDADPQGNLSRALAAETLGEEQATLADVLNPDPKSKAGHATHQLEDVIVATVFDKVELAPSRIELAVAEVNILGITGREHRLREALQPIIDRYDHVLIDCPPALGQLTINALTAADDVVVVTEAEQWSADGMAELRRTIERVQTYLNNSLAYAGVIINRYRPGTKLHQAGSDEIERYFTQAPVWNPYVDLTITIPESVAAGIGVDDHGSFSADRAADTFATYAANLTRS
jgi:chromosome partitioning protein